MQIATILVSLHLVYANINISNQFEPYGLVCGGGNQQDVAEQICLWQQGQGSDCEYLRKNETNNSEEILFKESLDQLCKRKDLITARGSHKISRHSLLESTISTISQYGCWCNFENGMTNGAGRSVNAVDEACKQLQLGYQCVRIDSKNGESCDTEMTEYNLTFGVDTEFLDFMCNMLNGGDPCASRLCALESYFIGILMNFSLEPEDQYPEIYKHPEIGGTFDFSSTCLGLDVSTSTESPVISPVVSSTNDDFGLYDYFMDDERSIEFHELDYEHAADSITITPVFPSNQASGTTSRNKEESSNIQISLHTQSQFSKPAALMMNGDNIQAPVEKICCGIYPNRKPIKHGIEKCCDNKSIYQANSEECCTKGWNSEVVSLGTC